MESSESDSGKTKQGAIFNHIGQCVTDLERSTRFYVELLGFSVEREMEIPDAGAAPFLKIDPPLGMAVAYLRRGELVLELMRFDRQGNPEFTRRVFNEPGLTHLSISVEDLDTVVARVAGLGGEVVTKFPGAAMVRDPDGQLLELLPLSYRRNPDAAS